VNEGSRQSWDQEDKPPTGKITFTGPIFLGGGGRVRGGVLDYGGGETGKHWASKEGKIIRLHRGRMRTQGSIGNGKTKSFPGVKQNQTKNSPPSNSQKKAKRQTVRTTAQLVYSALSEKKDNRRGCQRAGSEQDYGGESVPKGSEMEKPKL